MSYYDNYSYFTPRRQAPLGVNMMQNYPQMVPMQPEGVPFPALPTGVPGGPMVGQVPGEPIFPSTIPSGMLEQPVETLANPQFVPGYLKTQIGKVVRVEFLIGSSGPLVDRMGTLLEVGASYILIKPIESDDILMCDLYSIKFVTILL